MNKTDLAKLLGLDGLDAKEREETLMAISRLIFEAVLVRTVPLIPEDKLDTFETLLSGKKDEELYDFLEHEVPSFEQIVDEEVDNFRTMAVRMMPPVTA
jgi:hypothetical protein